MNAADFLELLSDMPQDMIAVCAVLLAKPPADNTSVLMPRIVSCAAAAACIAAVSGIGYLLKDDGMTQQNSIPEAVMQETAAADASETVAAAQTIAVSAEAAAPGQTETSVQSAEEVPAETAAETVWIPAETESVTADTGNAEPEPERITEPEITGDLDLDGRFTHADRLWAELIFSAELDGVADELPLTDAQLRQCDLIADDYRSPLGEAEYNAFQQTAKLIYQYDVPAVLNVRDYLGQQAYYDDYIKQKEVNPWEDPRIDWEALGLPAHPTEAEFLSALDWHYALEHAESKDEMTSGEKTALRKKCQSTAGRYMEMKAALYVPQEPTPEQQACAGLTNIIQLYVRSMHEARYGEQAWSWFAEANFENVPLLTQDELLAKLEAAKEWNFRMNDE